MALWVRSGNRSEGKKIRPDGAADFAVRSPLGRPGLVVRVCLRAFWLKRKHLKAKKAAA